VKATLPYEIYIALNVIDLGTPHRNFENIRAYGSKIFLYVLKIYPWPKYENLVRHFYFNKFS
jgi:hypothetical protein